MLRLRTTRVTITASTPGCGGWSADRGVDFALPPAPSPPALTPGGPDRSAAAEPASFLDADTAVAAAAPIACAPAAGRAEAAEVEPVVGAPLWAWSRLPARAPQT